MHLAQRYFLRHLPDEPQIIALILPARRAIWPQRLHKDLPFKAHLPSEQRDGITYVLQANRGYAEGSEFCSGIVPLTGITARRLVGKLISLSLPRSP
ncbi:MAG: hypothetical protein QOD00_4234 [Blastocatellia bacterium]|jgi:hypothetical protein|nr:hypothetical protein [Blastocatellia bacterium]